MALRDRIMAAPIAAIPGPRWSSSPSSGRVPAGSRSFLLRPELHRQAHGGFPLEGVFPLYADDSALLLSHNLCATRVKICFRDDRMPNPAFGFFEGELFHRHHPPGGMSHPSSLRDDTALLFRFPDFCEHSTDLCEPRAGLVPQCLLVL